MVATGPDQFTTGWRREKNIYQTDSSRSKEQLLGKGEQPWVAKNATGTYVVWLSRRYGDIWLAASNSTKPVKLSRAANDPVVSAPMRGPGPVVVVWEEGTKGHASLVAQVLD